MTPGKSGWRKLGRDHAVHRCVRSRRGALVGDFAQYLCFKQDGSKTLRWDVCDARRASLMRSMRGSRVGDARCNGQQLLSCSGPRFASWAELTIAKTRGSDMRTIWKRAMLCAFGLLIGAGLILALPQSQASPQDAGAADAANIDLAEPQKPAEPKSPPAVSASANKTGAGAIMPKEQKPASSEPRVASNAPGSTGTATPASTTQSGTLYLSERCSLRFSRAPERARPAHGNQQWHVCSGHCE